MLGASRLSSIWAGRCAKEKTTTQRARSPSGDQFMALALSLPVKKQISWCVFKRLGKDQEEILFLFSLVCLLSLLLSSLFFLAAYWAVPLSSLSGSSQDPKCKCIQSALTHARTPSHRPALEDAQTHMPALTYICWVWWMPMCKFFKRFSGRELEWALLLAEFLCLGPPHSAPRFAQ